MTVRNIAREWLNRPIVILICGKGDFVLLLDDDFVEIVHARTRAELDAGLRQPTIDVAIIEDTLWPGEDPVTLARTVRARGTGTFFAARTKQSGARLLRERMTIDLGSVRAREHLDNAIWLACCETELMRRDVPEWFNSISNSAAPAFMRFIEEDGHLAPSESTVSYIFDDLPLATPRIESLKALPVPSAPAVGSDAWASENRRTVAMQPSESMLNSLRRARDQNPWWIRPLTWSVAVLGLSIGLLALVIFIVK